MAVAAVANDDASATAADDDSFEFLLLKSISVVGCYCCCCSRYLKPDFAPPSTLGVPVLPCSAAPGLPVTRGGNEGLRQSLGV